MRFLIAVFSVVLLAFAIQPVWAQEGEATEEVRPVPVEVNVTLLDADGNPMSGIIVQAQQVGSSRSALTDKEGKCELHLLSGDWVIKAIRLGARKQLTRLEVSIGQEETIELPINITPERTSSSTDLTGPEALTGTEEISSESLGVAGKEALEELDLLTNMVLHESLKKILGQLSANDFTTSYWIQDQIASSDELGTSGEPLNSYRLDNDWSGQLMNRGSGRTGVKSSIISGNALHSVPVNVNFAVTPSTVNRSQGSIPIGNRGLAGEIGSSLIRLPGSLSRMITGGESEPGSQLGYDLGIGQRQFVSSSEGFNTYYNEVNSSIVNLYRPLRDRFTNQVVSNADTVRSVELGVEKTFIGGLRATVFYTYSEAQGLDIRTVDLHFEEWQDFENFLQNGIRHDLSTNLEASFSGTGTSLSLGYKFFINDVENEDLRDQVSSLVSDYSRLDIRLQQQVNIGILSSARVSFNFAINNLLNSTRNTYISPTDLDEELTDSRKMLGGIKIEF